MKHYLLLAVAAGVGIQLPTYGAEPSDSITRSLKEVVVTASRHNPDVIPAQTLEGDELHRLNSNSVADALRYFSGVQQRQCDLLYLRRYSRDMRKLYIRNHKF